MTDEIDLSGLPEWARRRFCSKCYKDGTERTCSCGYATSVSAANRVVEALAVAEAALNRLGGTTYPLGADEWPVGALDFIVAMKDVADTAWEQIEDMGDE